MHSFMHSFHQLYVNEGADLDDVTNSHWIIYVELADVSLQGGLQTLQASLLLLVAAFGTWHNWGGKKRNIVSQHKAEGFIR